MSNYGAPSSTQDTTPLLTAIRGAHLSTVSTNRSEEGDESNQKDAPASVLQIRVVSQDGSMIFFKCKQTTSFAKMFKAYGDRMGHSEDRIRFLFDGVRLKPEQTPAEFEMEDGDSIDVMMECVGGYQGPV
jgi:small ubiquitin-related modifier